MLIKIYPVSPLDRPFALGVEPTVIGREDRCQLRLNDDSISRCHAKFTYDGYSYRCEDLGSTNGTFINEVRETNAVLRSGDRIRFGNQIFKFLTLDGIESKYHEVVFKMMTTDGLTQLYNQTFFLDSLERELDQAYRNRQSICLLMMDMDNFKSINDTYGHLAGDAVLVEFARRATTVLRSGEVMARYGGEEFALLCAPATLAAGLVAAERVRYSVWSKPVIFEDIAIPATVSIGVSCYCGDEIVSSTTLLARADAMLYRAKQNGRNRIES